MTISVNWDTKIITVEKTDMTLIETVPYDTYELDVNVFRLALKVLEASSDGMTFLDTHRHVSEIILAGVTYFRVVEIINGYTVTFENDSYAVNLTNGNNNIADVINLNLVQLRTFNAAGSGLSSTQGGQFDEINEKVSDIYDVHGLDTSKPLVVSKTARTAGPGITQTIVVDPSLITTVTRT